MYKISEAAQICGLPQKTIRYYEEIGLVEAAGRNIAGYRFYDDQALQKLSFARRAREFGFSIEECRELLRLYASQDRASLEVKELAKVRLSEIEEKQRQLQLLHDELIALVQACPGDESSACPILDAMTDV